MSTLTARSPWTRFDHSTGGVFAEHLGFAVTFGLFAACAVAALVGAL